MSRPRARLNRALTIRLWLARAPAVLVVCALVLGFGWLSMKQRPGNLDRCLRAYAAARTAADSVSADQLVVGVNGRTTCGHLRRDGALERHPREVARTPGAGAAEGAPLIEK